MLIFDPEVMKAEAARAIEFFFEDNAVFEICAIGPRVPKSSAFEGFAGKGTISGWFRVGGLVFDPIINLVKAANAEGIYVTLNPCDPALTGRANHRFRAGINRTADKEIAYISNLLVDCDPERHSGVSSSEREHALALSSVREIAASL